MTDKPITFTDEQGVAWQLVWRNPNGPLRDATPADLARAGHEPSTQALDRLAIEAAIVADDTRRELKALRALEAYVRSPCGISSDPWPSEVSISRSIWADDVRPLLKAVDEARK